MAIMTAGANHQHFDPVKFDEELIAHGAPALWQQARVCPCIQEQTGQADPICPFCRDYPGIIWDAGTFLRMLAPGRRRSQEYDTAGGWVEGVVTLTFPSTVTPAHLDRVGFAVGEMVVNNERHRRGQSDPLGGSLERLRIRPCLSVDFADAIIGADPTTDPPTAGTLTRYVADVDFTIEDTGNIVWADSGPPSGIQYTLRYTTRPTFVCWSPESRDEFGAKMPYRVPAKRLDFLEWQSTNG